MRDSNSRPTVCKTVALPLRQSCIVTVYRVTRKLTIKAGFVFNKLNNRLPRCSTSFQLVSVYNFDTACTNSAVLFKLNSLHSVLCGFSSPSENSDFIMAVRQGFEPWVPISRYDGLANRSFRPLRHLTKPFATCLFKQCIIFYQWCSR